jgi:ketosteroid isomerase-like protein
MKASKTPSRPPGCGKQVILVVHERGRIKGTTTEVDGRWPFLATFRDRKLAKTEVFLTKEAALEAAGRSE